MAEKAEAVPITQALQLVDQCYHKVEMAPVGLCIHRPERNELCSAGFAKEQGDLSQTDSYHWVLMSDLIP